MSLCVESLSVAYGARTVLKNVSFSAEYGEVLSILGPNGVGKSTLLRCLLGILPPDGGSVVLDGADVQSLSPQTLAKKVAYIPQSHNPVFQYTVFDMVLMGTAARTGAFSVPGAAQKARAQAAMEKLGIGQLAARGYRALSGGERQMVLIARALAQEAKLLLMDEPTASLDFANREKVMQTARNLAGDGYAIVQTTHDPEQAYRVSDRILTLSGGTVLACGTPQEIICGEILSKLYGLDVEVCSLQNDRIRACAAKKKEEF